MADSDKDSDCSESISTPKGKSTKVNFLLLKHILDDELTEISDSEEVKTTKSNNNTARKLAKEEDQEIYGPLGAYPVKFTKKCKSKSCQTRLSAFPLFSVPDETEWISDEEELSSNEKAKCRSFERLKSAKKGRKNSSNNNIKITKKEEIEKVPVKTKNPDGTRKEFQSEHQLKESKNPIIQAWIQNKNKQSRKNRKEEKKEKKAQRIALQEEERLKLERLETSEKKVKEWFKVKKKTARKLWRQNHPRVSPIEVSVDDQPTVTPPSHEYKVVSTLRHNALGSARLEGTSSNESQANSSNKTFVSPQRPKTAKRTRTAVKTNISRPKTAVETKNDVSKEKPMRSLSYDEWLKSKRELDRNKAIERRRELIDSHLDAVITKLGKQRVDKIISPRKHIDTGLKNYNRVTTPTQSATKKEIYKWISRDSQRPEPQGCDCTEAEHLDSTATDYSTVSQQNRADEFCKEVVEKCDELKPSMDKVLAVLDSEMKKCSMETKTQTKISKTPGSIVSSANATCQDTIDQEKLQEINQKSSRPKSAKPQMINDKTKKKILHDIDVLGLLETDELLQQNITTTKDSVPMTTSQINNDITMAIHNTENMVDIPATLKSEDKSEKCLDKLGFKSTVRNNYFEY